MDTVNEGLGALEPTNDLTIVYTKSKDYRVYAAPLVWGALTPDAKAVLMNICVEQVAMPSYTTHEYTEQGVNPGIIKQEARRGEVEREMQCGIYMTIDTAKTVAEWLDRMVEMATKGGGR